MGHHLGAPAPLASHCWLEREHDGTPGLGIEATVADGVHQFPATAKNPRHQTIRCYYVLVDAEQEAAVWTAGLGYIARRTRYNLPGLGRALWYVLTGQRRDAFTRDPHVSVFCSELTTDLLRAGGVDVEMEHSEGGTFQGVPSTNISPARLEKWAVTHCQPVP